MNERNKCMKETKERENKWKNDTNERKKQMNKRQKISDGKKLPTKTNK